MATLYVNADHAGADDAGDYAAAQVSSTPLQTIGRAMALALLDDTIEVSYAEAAGSDDVNGQVDVYAYTPDDTFGGGAAWPHKDATDGRITIQGVAVGGQQPKWLGISARHLRNWKIDGFQIGYDLGSGFEYNTATSLLGVEDCLFSNCLYTGGVANILGYVGHNRWENCEVVSKLRPSPAGFMEGAGARVLGFYDSEFQAGADDWVEFVGCNFHDVQGEDAIQLLISVGFGSALVEDCKFNDMAQTGAAHTDAIQILGGSEIIVRRNTFGVDGLVASMVIGTDGPIDSLTLENNLFVGQPGAGYSSQFGGGVRNAVIRHNTWVRSVFGGLRFHQQTPAHEPVGSESIVMCNNLVDRFEVDHTITWDETDQFNNVVSIGPATSADIVAVPEYGESVDTVFELSNSPIDSAGVDDGAVTDITADRLGRARQGSAPDCGCHESNSAVPIVTAPRSPILVGFSPTGSSVVDDTSVTATLYPKPGEELAAESVDASTAYVQDAAGFTIPAVVSLSDLDEAGRQTITLDLRQSLEPLEDGVLFPLVSYTVSLTDDIEDTEASVFTGSSWTFRVAGTGGPAIASTAPGGGGGDGTFMSGGFLRDAATRALVVVVQA